MSCELAKAAMGQVVAIAIGPNKTVFRLHKDILCSKSDYFRTAYNGRWKESEDGMTLEDVEVGVFNVFVHWLYTQQLPARDDLLSIATVDRDDWVDNDHPYGTVLLKACAFGNRFLVADFERITHNRSIDYFGRRNCVPVYQHVIFAYKNLPGNSQILNLMVEMQCVAWSPNDDDDDEEQRRVNLPKDFLIRVMIRHSELCIYHGREYKNPRHEHFYIQEKVEEVGK